jgi:acyl transferase domain-containing protein
MWRPCSACWNPTFPEGQGPRGLPFLLCEKHFVPVPRTDQASRSRHWDTILSQRHDLLGTGKQIAGHDLRSPDYWIENLVSPVQFARTFQQICTKFGRKLTKKLDESHRSRLAINILLEVGAHSALQGPIRDLLEAIPWDHNVHYTPVLRRAEPATQTFLSALGHLYCFGYQVGLQMVNRLDKCFQRRTTRRLSQTCLRILSTNQ